MILISVTTRPHKPWSWEDETAGITGLKSRGHMASPILPRCRVVVWSPRASTHGLSELRINTLPFDKSTTFRSHSTKKHPTSTCLLPSCTDVLSREGHTPEVPEAGKQVCGAISQY